MMTLDDLISSLTTWRDLKKIGDAPVSIMLSEPYLIVPLTHCTFAAGGDVYVHGEDAPDLPIPVHGEYLTAEQIEKLIPVESIPEEWIS